MSLPGETKMTTWFHTTILATSLVATLAVGIAGAAIVSGDDSRAAPKADRLPVASVSGMDFTTVETRADGVSVLSRIPAEKPVAAN